MKIGINGYEAVVSRFGFNEKTGLPNRVGSSEVCYQTLLNLAQIDKKNDYTIFLPVDPVSDLPKERENWKYNVFSSRNWTLFGLSKQLAASKLNVFFSPTHYLPLRISVPSVISILDVSYLYFPNLFKRKDLYQLKKLLNFTDDKDFIQKWQIIKRENKDLIHFIGPPLHVSFRDFFETDAKAFEAVDVYREYYSDKGIFENLLFDGIPELLQTLQQKGKTICPKCREIISFE